MPRRGIKLNELIFSIYHTRYGQRRVQVTVDNAEKTDARFMAAVAHLIAVWISSKEV